MATSLSDLELAPRSTDVEDVPVDKLLVLGFQTGDPDAYDRIFERYRPLTERICFRILGNREDAQEAVQETMLRVLRGLGTFNGRYQLQAWIARIATNVSVDMVRARGRRPQSTGGLHDLGADADAALDPGELVEQILEQERVRSILDEIPSHHRQALVLREFEGRSHEEIGDALGVSPAQAKALIHRAKSTFRRAWGEERRGIAAFLPWFLIPSLFRRIGGTAQTLATRATASPAVAEATASTAEKVTAAAVAVVVAGSVGVGAYAVRHVDRPSAAPVPTHAAPAPSASPAPVLQEIAPPPTHPTPGRAVVKARHHQKDHTGPAVPPATTPSPGSDPSPTPDPGDTSPPPVVLGPPPAWSGAFSINWASDGWCGCGPGLNLASSSVTGQLTPDTGLDVQQQLTGAAIDGEGDAAWAITAALDAHLEAAGGHLSIVFTLGDHTYSADVSAPSVVNGIPANDQPMGYMFSGTYALSGGDPDSSPIRTEGLILVQMSVWGDGTSVFGTVVQLPGS